jgi:hypothetical protein
MAKSQETKAKPVDEKLQRKIEDGIILFDKLVNTLPKERKDKLKEFLNGPMGEAFFCAPASARTDYHDCYPGGLLLHSLKVYDNLKKLVVCTNFTEANDETLTFVSLFHDLGKAGDGENEYLLQNDSAWHVKNGMPFNYNEDCLVMPSGERTLFLFQKMGLELTSDEFLAIRLCEAPQETIDFYKYREPKLALLLNFANRWAMNQ